MNIPVHFRGVSGQKYKLIRQKIETDSSSNAVGITLVYKVQLFCSSVSVVSDAKALCKKLSSDIPPTMMCKWMLVGWEDSNCKTFSVFCSFVAGAEIKYFETQVSGGAKCS